MHTIFWSENRKERDHWQDLGVDGVIILIQILKKDCMRSRTGFNWPELEFSEDSCEHGIEHPVSAKGAKFLD